VTVLQRRKKVEIVIDATALDRVLDIVRQAGARGHTVVPNVGGRGDRGVRAGDDLFGVFQNALVIAIVDDAAADRIVTGVLEVLKTRPGIVYTSDVEIAREDQF
jgi:nitrogen regulatory protein PII